MSTNSRSFPMIKIKNKRLYYLYVFYTVLSFLITLAAYVAMIASFVEPAVPLNFKILTVLFALAFTRISYGLLESCLTYFIQEEKEKQKAK